MTKYSAVFRSILLKIIFLFGCCPLSTVSAGLYNIIPYPQHLIPQSGKFTFNKRTVIMCAGQNAEVLKLARQFSDQMALVSGLKLPVKEMQQADTANAVIFQPDKSQAGNDEAYSLNISAKTIRIKASASNGAFYSLQTIYQLLPSAIYGKTKATVKEWSVPAVSIADVPRFAYRGLHLDVCRHFFPVEFIKKYIDAMAIHKFNRFHWHLTDDQGWRIEIKKYPLLTKVGSRRVETLVGYYFENFPQRFDDDAYSGFYTQDEAREIVAYAKERFITVIPEIEMPGHAVAAIASYPYLSCNRTPMKVETRWGIFKDVFCTRDSTFTFLEDVLTEIMDIFPGKYIHIGGDECPKDRWKTCPDCQAKIKSLNLKDESELQSYFIHRIEKFLNAHGRQIIGWDEILDGGLAPNATVMSWRGTKGGIAAAQSGHDVIMTPTSFCYFDQYQSDPVTEPTTIGGFIPLKRVYFYEPVPEELTPDQAKHILGAQANLWSEYMPNTERVEYMAYPRASAMAEVLWSEPTNRNWDRFRGNMAKEYERLAAMNIRPANVFFDVQCQSSVSADRKVLVTLEADNPNAEIRYTLDGSSPTAKSKLYTEPLKLSEPATVKAVAVEKGKITGKEFSKSFIVSKATGLSYVQNPINTWYRGDNVYSLTDGVIGNTKSISQWIAVGGSKDGEFVIDLLKTQNINRLSVGLLNAPAFCGLYPPEIKVFTSADGSNYTQVASQTVAQRTTGAWEIYRPELVFP
ncbi:MAG TPA: family 20 glycosylhydrolase, partial [Paludibacter sp.]